MSACVFFLMIRRPPRSTLDRSSAASDVYKRQESYFSDSRKPVVENGTLEDDQNRRDFTINALAIGLNKSNFGILVDPFKGIDAVSYTHLRAHETVLDLVCRLLLEKKTTTHTHTQHTHNTTQHISRQQSSMQRI